MNEHLLQLIALWSGCFISRHGPVVVLVGMRDKLIELLEALPPSFEGVEELRRQAMLLGENETIGIDHPLNRAMFAFMVKYERQFSEEYQANLENIKSFFSNSR